MPRRKVAAALTAITFMASVGLAGCGRSPDESSADAAEELVETTSPGTEESGRITWAVYRDVQTLDPIYAYDYPDNTAVTLMCESLLRTQPDGSVAEGLAKMSRPDPTTVQFDIAEDATFWDGSPVTADDVVYSLERNTDPDLGGFYSDSFSRVHSITATGPRQVTLKLTEPDYWLQGELAYLPGIVVKKELAEEQGREYGTPEGDVMCTGAYKLESWDPATGVVAEPNEDYWASDDETLASQITLKGIPDEAALTSGLLTGEVSGTYPTSMSSLPQLEASDEVRVHQGPSYNTDALIISNLDGALGDVRVRQALSLALDREAFIEATYKGAAQMPKWMSNEGTFGYATETFQAAYDDAPELTANIDKAKELIKDAGAEGETITIGTSNAVSTIAGEVAAYEAAGDRIGLDVELKNVSPESFINFFTDPKARADVDAFPVTSYGNFAGPEAMISQIVLPDSPSNYSGFEDERLTAWLNQARSTADPEQRAELMIKVEERFNELLPWIPLAQPTTVLVMNREISGAISSFAYMMAPWANELGGI